MITWDDVTTIAAELADVPAPSRVAILAMVEEQLAESVWGSRLKAGRVYLAAHLGTVAKRGGAAGVVVSESLGQASRSYAVASMDGGSLDSTSYGAEYRRLVNTLASARVGFAV